MPDEFKPIEKDIKDALTKAVDDVETGYPKHLKEIADRAEKVVVGGTKKVDDDNAANIKKILDDMDANKTRTDISGSAKAAQEGKLTSQLRSILDPEGEAKRGTDVNSQITGLGTQGHGPGRHLNPTETELKNRLGKTKIDPTTKTPKLKQAGPNIGHVASEDFIDPMTGTTIDHDTGKAHVCGPYATKFNSADDMARADDYFRAQIAATGKPPGSTPISDVLGPDGHHDLTGVYKDPANPSTFKPVDFEDGTIRPVYNFTPHPTDPTQPGTWTLKTMFPEPKPGKHP